MVENIKAEAGMTYRHDILELHKVCVWSFVRIWALLDNVEFHSQIGELALTSGNLEHLRDLGGFSCVGDVQLR